MKLLHKENLFLIPIYLFIFALVGLGFYYAAQMVLHEDVEDLLLARKEFLLKNIKDIREFEKYQQYSFNTLKIEETTLPVSTDNNIKDTVLYDSIEKKYELSSILTFVVSEGGKNYQISLKRTRVNTSEWAVGIVQVVVILFVVLLVLLFAANVILTKRIWNPFYKTLDQLLAFKVSDPADLHFPETNITEFRQLFEVLGQMTDKIREDYESLKHFSENASHEFQTPLAVIKVKLDMLLQSPHLSSEELEWINSALKSVKKLSKLNEALLLLTKIENRQFDKVTTVNIEAMMKEKLEHLAELIRLKNLHLSTHYSSTLFLMMDHLLADLLIENLLSNAIKHNYDGGEIIIQLQDSVLEIRNTGPRPSLPVRFLFERFRKSNQNSESLGLGLAIVQEICHTYHLQIAYRYEVGYHIMSIRR